MFETSFEISVTLTFLALLIEALVGYPDRLVRAIGHPVTWIGALIARLDAGLNRPSLSPGARRVAGVVSLAIIVAVAAAAGVIVERGLLLLPFGILLAALAASALIAQRSLYEHVAAVATALERDGLAAGRVAVAKIVGRDPQALDEAGVARAAIESLAENFSDGVVAPVFWMALAGLPGAAAYKAINTADSMIGHRTAAPRSVRMGRRAPRRPRQPAGLAARRAARCGRRERSAAALPQPRHGARSSAMPAVIARPMPDIPRRPSPARSASRSPARGSMPASRSTMPSWATGGARPPQPISVLRSRSTGAPTPY